MHCEINERLHFNVFNNNQEIYFGQKEANGVLEDNFERISEILRKELELFRINLENKTVVCEAASKLYSLTPSILLLSGAKEVYAINQPSKYGTLDEVRSLVEYVAEKLAIDEHRLKIIHSKDKSNIEEPEIILNQRWVRPIDDSLKRRNLVQVISLMYEPWELRRSDIDWAVWGSDDVLIAGTNEEFLGLLDYCGPLCIKILMESQIEVMENIIGILGSGKFPGILAKYLRRLDAKVTIFNSVEEIENRKLDVLIVADIESTCPVIDQEHIELFKNRRSLTILQFAGGVNCEGVLPLGITCVPSYALPPQTMFKELSHLGPVPLIKYLCGGIKVGELLHRIACEELSLTDLSKFEKSLIYPLNSKNEKLSTLKKKI